MTTAVDSEEVVVLAEHIIKRGEGCPSSKPYALVSKSTGRVLGCHPSKGDAMKQEAAIKASGHWELQREDVAKLCGACAQKMESLNIAALKLSDVEPLPPDFEQALRSAVTNAASEHDPGFFRYCRQRIGPRTEAFCAWLHHKLLGRWPSQDSTHFEPDAAKAQYYIQIKDAAALAPRQAMLHGRPHRVVSAVLVRSQVLQNNLGRSYLPAADMTEEWADAWNGIPVLVGDHPQQRGQHVSGRDPALWDERMVGWIFNAHVESEGRDRARLVAEVWLDETRADAVDGFKAVLEAVQAGHVVELSTGFSTKTEQSTGQFGGETYELIMHPVAPDHLVISTEMTGACSVRDGCGLGAHAREDEPVETKESKSIWSRVAALFDAKPTKLSREEHDALRIKRLVESANETMPTDGERLQMMREALQSEYGASEVECVIADTITATKQVIFWWATPMGPFPKGGEYLMSTWTENAGKYEFSEPVPVRRMTSYEPVANQVSADNRGVAAATNLKPGEGKESTMSDQEKELAAQVKALATAVEGLANRFTAFETSAKSDPNPAIAGLKQSVAKLSDDLASMRGITEAAVQERERERQSLIRKLAGHYRVPFTEADLETKPLDELRKLEQMAAGNNFEGRGGPQGGQTNVDAEQRFAEPTSPWSKDEKKGGE